MADGTPEPINGDADLTQPLFYSVESGFHAWVLFRLPVAGLLASLVGGQALVGLGVVGMRSGVMIPLFLSPSSPMTPCC